MNGLTTPTPSTRVVIIAVGGPTCSGKTTLAKHLNSILPNSVILHQDDFAPPSELVPIDPVHNVQDWDDPEGAIEWHRLRETLRYMREHGGAFPSSHYSHDHLNQQASVPIPQTLLTNWRARFSTISPHAEAPSICYVIADGFLLYWDEECVKEYDVKLFVRESEGVLKRRRVVRQTYYTATQSSPDGSLWRDPPGYWDAIVWPAYLKGHRRVFANGDVEHGEPEQTSVAGKGLVLLQPAAEKGADGGSPMADSLDRALEEIWKVAMPPPP